MDFDNLTKLKDLKMQRCPPLPLSHLERLSSLKTLHLEDPSSGLWPAEGSRAGNLFPVEYLSINQCGASGKEFTQLLSHFPMLSNLVIDNCPNITRVGVMGTQATEKSGPSSSPSPRLEFYPFSKKKSPSPSASSKMVEEDMQIGQNQIVHARGDEELEAEAEDEEVLLLPPNLQKLRMHGCRNLVFSLPSDSLDGDKKGGGGGGLQGLRSLQSLDTFACPKLLCSHSSSSSYFYFPSSLQFLKLYNLEGREATTVPFSSLVSLTRLSIHGCWYLRSEGLGTLLTKGQLTELSVMWSPLVLVDCSSPTTVEEEPFPCSSKLRELYTDDITGVLTATFCSLVSSSLATLEFNSNRDVEHFTPEQEDALLLLASMQDLQFILCSKMQQLPAGLAKLDKLKKLYIRGNRALRSLPKDGLPSSLQDLTIVSCPAIRSLPKVDRLASSLLSLKVNARNSKELINQCRKLKGTIPIVEA